MTEQEAQELVWKLRGLIEERDPEHGTTHIDDNFLDEYATDEERADPDFNCYDFIEDHPKEYAEWLQAEVDEWEEEDEEDDE